MRQKEEPAFGALVRMTAVRLCDRQLDPSSDRSVDTDEYELVIGGRARDHDEVRAVPEDVLEAGVVSKDDPLRIERPSGHVDARSDDVDRPDAAVNPGRERDRAARREVYVGLQIRRAAEHRRAHRNLGGNSGRKQEGEGNQERDH